MSEAPSMLPSPPAEWPYVVRLRLRIRQLQEENRRLRFDNGALRRELSDLRHKLRRKQAA